MDKVFTPIIKNNGLVSSQDGVDLGNNIVSYIIFNNIINKNYISKICVGSGKIIAAYHNNNRALLECKLNSGEIKVGDYLRIFTYRKAKIRTLGRITHISSNNNEVEYYNGDICSIGINNLDEFNYTKKGKSFFIYRYSDITNIIIDYKNAKEISLDFLSGLFGTIYNSIPNWHFLDEHIINTNIDDSSKKHILDILLTLTKVK